MQDLRDTIRQARGGHPDRGQADPDPPPAQQPAVQQPAEQQQPAAQQLVEQLDIPPF
jgi:hypothetical protein